MIGPMYSSDPFRVLSYGVSELVRPDHFDLIAESEDPGDEFIRDLDAEKQIKLTARRPARRRSSPRGTS